MQEHVVWNTADHSFLTVSLSTHQASSVNAKFAPCRLDIGSFAAVLLCLTASIGAVDKDGESPCFETIELLMALAVGAKTNL